MANGARRRNPKAVLDRPTCAALDRVACNRVRSVTSALTTEALHLFAKWP